MNIFKYSVVTSLLCLVSTSFAQTNAIPSCYNSKVLEITSISNKELFLIIDQTTLLDNQLKQQLADQIRPFLTYGNAISVTVFSSFNQGKYTRVVTSGRIQHKLPEGARADTSKPLLQKFD